MEEQLISFETAKLAKDKGFELQQRIITRYPNGEESDEFGVPQSLLQKWLRVNHDIHIEIVYWEDNTWSAQLVGDIFQDESGDDYEAFGCDTYENALEIGLQEALKLIE
jgi:hypothetical protein